MERVSANGIELAYRSMGEGDSVVLFVHGWMTSGAVYDGLTRELSSARTRFIVPDLRGAGDSDNPSSGYTLEQMASDLWALVDALEVRPIVVGHSMGGQLAQLMATTRPRDLVALALLCPVPAGGFTLDERSYDVFESAAGKPEEQGRILDAATHELVPSERARLVELAGTVSDVCWKATLEAWTRGGFADRVGQVEVPTLAIATDDPFLTPAIIQEEVVDRIRGSRMSVLHGPGHYPQIEALEPTAALLAEFFDQIAK